jgi:hypothetical protein
MGRVGAMATVNKPTWRLIVEAYAALPPQLRHKVIWRMNEATIREMSRHATYPLPDDEPLPEPIQLFSINVEVTEAPEVLLVMKVA